MSKSFREDLTGRRFGRLTVIEFVPNDKRYSHWKCICDCGNYCTISSQLLHENRAKSCGCLRKESALKRAKASRKYNVSKPRVYRIWNRMKNRCYNAKTSDYKNYGGKGISMCSIWLNDFMSFYKWSMANGYDDTLTIDRIDVSGNYEPNNCRWVDRKTQNRNRNNNVLVEYNNRSITLGELAEITNFNYNSLQSRYRKGDRGERLLRPLKSK